MRPETLIKWHKLLETRNLEVLGALLSENVVFHSPIVHTPQVGKAITEKYLGAALAVLVNDTFEYVREIVEENQAMLEFVVQLDDIQVNGVDIIQWDEDNRIVDFKVLVRPLKAVNIVHERMMAMLQGSR